LITTEEAIERMTVEQMMLTRLRQTRFEELEAEDEYKADKLRAEKDILGWLLKEQELLQGEQLGELKQAIKTGEPPGTLDQPVSSPTKLKGGD